MNVCISMGREAIVMMKPARPARVLLASVSATLAFCFWYLAIHKNISEPKNIYDFNIGEFRYGVMRSALLGALVGLSAER